MLNQTTQPGQRTRLWFLSLACLIDSFLDRIEKFSGFVLPAESANPPYGTEIETRLEQLGAQLLQKPMLVLQKPMLDVRP